MNEFLREFKRESRVLVKEMMKILDAAEAGIFNRTKLQMFAQMVDRLIGGAKVLLLHYPDNDPLYVLANYSELCKLVGKGGARIEENQELYAVVVAFSQDAVDLMDEMVNVMDHPEISMRSLISETFAERLKWISRRLIENYQDCKGSPPLTQTQVDHLLSNLNL